MTPRTEKAKEPVKGTYYFLLKKFAALELGLPDLAALSKKAGTLLSDCKTTLKSLVSNVDDQLHHVSNLVATLGQHPETEDKSRRYSQLLPAAQETVKKLHQDWSELNTRAKEIKETLSAAKDDSRVLLEEKMNKSFIECESKITKLKANAQSGSEQLRKLLNEITQTLHNANIPTPDSESKHRVQPE